MMRGSVEWFEGRRDCRCNALTLQRFNVISISDLPAINATLNFVSTIFISAGWYFIRRNFWQRHVVCMVTAVVSSALFLVGYITYHIHVGETSSGFRGWRPAIYFPMLATHVLLAFVTLLLLLLTLMPLSHLRGC